MGKQSKYNLTYSLAFLPSQNAIVPYTIGQLISTSFSPLFELYAKPKINQLHTMVASKLQSAQVEKKQQ